ncbi:MAG: uroporphyrinogen-III C-methyltransferase [Thermoplasmatales archaeon]|nr:MAG: uroporphyrinogen-III C-methyltransferase [Thermoplasmatales archaeon]
MVVYIVGAGPGDLELITIKAKGLIENAEVILYDKLVNKEILNWALPDCEFIYVGKREKDSKTSQSIQKDINSLIQKYGKSKRVVRLKGGDPLIFGRGGEEAQICARNKIPFEIIPGISSAIAAPAYAGIPVSHRDFNSSFAILTGHESDKDDSAIDWKHLPETLIILMGVKKIKETALKLLDLGRDPSTPVAAVYRGTTIKQKTVITSLEKLAKGDFSLTPPIVFIVGSIVTLHKELNWYERKLNTISGKNIVLTRAKTHLKESKELIESYGMKVISMPLIELIFKDFKSYNLDRFDAIIFTSVEGVKRVKEKLDLKDFKGKFFAIGPKTKNKLKELGLNASIGKSYNSNGLAEHIINNLSNGSKILAFRSSAASDVLKNKLADKYEIMEEYVYDIKRLPADPEKIKKGDAVFVVSASCAKSIAELEPSILKEKTLVSIGPETSKNLPIPHIAASEFTIQGMINVYFDYLWQESK